MWENCWVIESCKKCQLLGAIIFGECMGELRESTIIDVGVQCSKLTQKGSHQGSGVLPSGAQGAATPDAGAFQTSNERGFTQKTILKLEVSKKDWKQMAEIEEEAPYLKQRKLQNEEQAGCIVTYLSWAGWPSVVCKCTSLSSTRGNPVSIARNRRQNPYILIWLGPGRRTGRRRGSVTCTETSPIQSQWHFRSDFVLPSEIGTSWCGRILYWMAFVSFCLYLSKKKERKKS